MENDVEDVNVAVLGERISHTSQQRRHVPLIPAAKRIREREVANRPSLAPVIAHAPIMASAMLVSVLTNGEPHVELLLVGAIDPDEVTARLQRTPTRVFSKGEQIGTGFTDRVHDRSGWVLDSRGAVDAGNIVQPHLDWMLTSIEPRGAVLAELRHEGMTSTIWCGWPGAGTGGGPVINALTLARLGALDLDLVISFYVS